MMEFVRGDMFDVPAEIRVNTVNCVGVMGAGVALAFKTRYPEMFRDYKNACDRGDLRPGKLHVWKTLTEWIINFPTKRHWRDNSRYDDVAAGLSALREYLATLGTVRVTLPALGCGHGGLEWARVSEMIRDVLHGLEAQIYVFEPADSVNAGQRAAIENRATSIAKELNINELGGWSGVMREWNATKAYFVGDSHLLTKPWLAVILSVKPDSREEDAALACVDSVVRPGITVALRQGGRTSRLLCEAALARGANVILWATEGVDQVRLSRERQADVDAGRLVVVGIAKPNDRWNETNAKRALLLQFGLARAALITDPKPEWPRRDMAWPRDVFYVRYGNAQPSGLGALLRTDATHAVSRDRHTGLPKTAPLLAALGVV